MKINKYKKKLIKVYGLDEKFCFSSYGCSCLNVICFKIKNY